MIHICLVRHGETDWNLQQRVQGTSDISLNERGRTQALGAARYLARDTWDALYSSPLSRAYETASIIGGETGLSSIVGDPRLKERHFGEAEGIEVTERRNFYRSREIPGAEPWEAVQRRGVEFMEELKHAHRNERVLVVAHGGLIAGILSYYSDGEIRPGEPPLKNTCMNLLSYDENWRIMWYNKTAREAEEAPVTV